jgi:hypothetical protein
VSYAKQSATRDVVSFGELRSELTYDDSDRKRAMSDRQRERILLDSIVALIESNDFLCGRYSGGTLTYFEQDASDLRLKIAGDIRQLGLDSLDLGWMYVFERSAE